MQEAGQRRPRRSRTEGRDLSNAKKGACLRWRRRLIGSKEKHMLFGGGIQCVAFEHLGVRRKSALAHTMDAAGTAVAAVRNARKSVAVALRAVI